MARSVQHFLSLLTVQMQIQYHCGHKVQDSVNITKHLKAIAAGMDGKVTCKHNQVLSIK